MKKLAAVAIGLLVAAFSSVAMGREPNLSPRIVASTDLPREAHQTLERIKTGGPFPYQKDGIVFGNFERRLPPHERGYYHEYTVPTPKARDRGARRIIAGRAGEFYYTDDHYNSFKRIRE